MAASEAAAGEAPARQKTSILGLASLALLMAMFITSGICIALGDELLPLETYQRIGSNKDAIFEFSLAAAIGLLCAVLVWLCFYLRVFRGRAKLWKSLIALLLMVIVAAPVAVLVRGGTLVFHYMADEQTVTEMHEATRARLRALKAQSAPNLEGLRMDQGIPHLERAQDLEALRGRMLAARDQMTAYRAAVLTELQRSRDAMAAIDIYGSVREGGLSFYDERMAPDSNTQRHLARTEAILTKGGDLIAYLLQHRDGWVIDDGVISVTDRAVFNELRRLNDELEVIGGELDHLEGAMGRELAPPPADATP